MANLRTARALLPDTTSALLYTFSYKVIVDDADFTNSPNTLIVLMTIFILLLMINEMLDITHTIRVMIEKELNTRVITPESQPYFPELIYMAVRATESALDNAFNLAKAFFGTLLAVLLTNIQPPSGEATLVYRLLLTVLMFTYFFMILYGLRIIQ